MSQDATALSTADLATAISHAILAHEPLPEIHQTFTMEAAYEIQHAVTAHRCPGRIGGIKAGVTQPALQKRLGIDHALLGSLYADACIAPGSTLPHIDGRMLECELAVIVDRHGRPRSLAPAIEIAYVRLSRAQDMSAANLVLCNVGADAYVVGKPLPWGTGPADASVTLTRDGDLLNRATLTDSPDGPERSIAWIWQESIRRGFTPAGETLLLTGACGKVVPAEPGRYSADFGALGRIEFEVAQQEPGGQPPGSSLRPASLREKSADPD